MNKIQEKKLQEDRGFTVEDNILIGPQKSIDLISFNIGEVLLDAFNKTPDHIFQIDAATNNTTTYAEMKDCIIRCSLWMEKQGLSCNDIISVYTTNQFDYYIPAFATYFVQAILNPWRAGLDVDIIRVYLRLFAPKLIFTCVDGVDTVDEALALEKLDVKIVVLGKISKHQSLNDILQSQLYSDVEKYHPRTIKKSKDVAIIITTSGTTYFPKAVMISAEAMLMNVASYDYSCIGKKLCWYGPPPGIRYNKLILVSILQNATRIIHQNIDIREMCATIEKFKINYVHANPTIFNLLANFEDINKYNMDCLDALHNGGRKLNKITFDKLTSSCLREKIGQSYGNTEVNSGCILPKLDQNQTSHNSIGYVTSNLQVKIADRLTKEALGPNKPGELLLKSPAIMLGYYKNPEATNKAIDCEGWYHTQDLGYYDEHGEIYIIDRISNAFMYCGQEMFTTDIEDIFWTHPSIKDVAVVARPEKSCGEIPVAFVVIQPGEKVTEEDIAKLFTTFEKCRTLRGRVQFIEEIPVTYISKHDRTYLKKLALKLTN